VVPGPDRPDVHGTIDPPGESTPRNVTIESQDSSPPRHPPPTLRGILAE
jgi:hypothetical protein